MRFATSVEHVPAEDTYEPPAPGEPPSAVAPEEPPYEPPAAPEPPPAAESLDPSEPAPEELAPEEPAPEEEGPSLDSPSSPAVHHRRKLAATTMFDRSKPQGGKGAKPPTPKPRPAKPKDIRQALKGLFTSLSLDELPPARSEPLEDDVPTAPPAPPEPDAPGQMALFTGPGAKKAALPHPAEKDELFPAAVVAALERGSASLVLLKRRLNVGYARAASLMEALVAQGVLGDMTASGSRPTLLTQSEWNRRARK